MSIDLDLMERVITLKTLNDEEYILSIGDHLKPELFKDKNLCFVYNLAREFYDKHNELPSLDELKLHLSTPEHKISFAAAMQSISKINKSTKFNRDELYQNTERFIKERALYKTMMEVAADIGAGEIDTSKILDRFEKSCSFTLVHDIGLDLFKDFKRVEADLTQKEPVISTGYKWIDDKLAGGFLQRGRAMYVFAGETNIGKSIILGNLAVNIARQKKTVLVISLEMSEMMYARRLTAHITNTCTRQLADTIDVVSAKMENFQNTTGGRIIVKEFPPSCMTPRDIQAYIKKLTKNGIRIDAIVLDYINLLAASKGKDSYERIKYISEETRALTYHFSCPLITVTQLNRTGYSVSEPGLTALSESYALGATADFIASIWQSDDLKALNTVNISILKNRAGINTGTQPFKIDYSTLTMMQSESLTNFTNESETAEQALKAFQSLELPSN